MLQVWSLSSFKYNNTSLHTCIYYYVTIKLFIIHMIKWEMSLGLLSSPSPHRERASGQHLKKQAVIHHLIFPYIECWKRCPFAHSFCSCLRMIISSLCTRHEKFEQHNGQNRNKHLKWCNETDYERERERPHEGKWIKVKPFFYHHIHDFPKVLTSRF